MNLTEELATLCVKSAAGEYSPELRDLRTSFEASARNEQRRREIAEKYRALADQRAQEEDTSLGGYAATMASRLAPIPQTGTEALLRLPATAAGGALGYHIGKGMEGFDSPGLQSLLKPNDTRTSNRFANILRQVGFEDTKGLMGALRQIDPDTLSASLRRVDVPLVDNTELNKVRDLFNNSFKGTGRDGTSVFRQEAENLIGQAAKVPKGMAESATSALTPHRVLGTLGGAGAAALLTGIPYALRALWQKGQGGEASVRARGRMDEALSEADNEAAKREELLASLPKSAADEASIQGELSGIVKELAALRAQWGQGSPEEQALRAQKAGQLARRLRAGMNLKGNLAKQPSAPAPKPSPKVEAAKKPPLKAPAPAPKPQAAAPKGPGIGSYIPRLGPGAKKPLMIGAGIAGALGLAPLAAYALQQRKKEPAPAEAPVEA